MESINLIRINLLPPEDRVKRDHLWAKAGVLAAMTLVTAGCILASIILNVMVLKEQYAVNRARIEIASHQEEINEYTSLRAQADLLAQRHNIIDELVVKRTEWAPKLNLLSDLIPEDVWLEKVYVKRVPRKVKVEPKPPKKGQSAPKVQGKKTQIIITDYLMLHGATHKVQKDTAIVAQVLENLQNSEAFVGDEFVSIDDVQQKLEPYAKRLDGGPLVWRFEIECKMNERESLESTGA